MALFLTGLLIGIFAGILITLGTASFMAKRMVPGTQAAPGAPDLAVIIGEGYLNREAAKRVAAMSGPEPGPIALTELTLDLGPNNSMRLQPTFKVDAFLTTFDVSPLVDNRLSVQDGKLAINMQGDPQIGDLNVSLDLLPFDLRGEITRAVDEVNNRLLLSEINDSLQTAFGGTNFVVESVSTDDSGMTITLRER